MIETIHAQERIDALPASGVEKQPGSCLVWWRSKSAGEYDAEALRTMRASLAVIATFGDDRWRAAAAGDAAAAIGIVYGIRKNAAHEPFFDAAMTALALAAGTGNAAACLVLATVLRGTADDTSAHRGIAAGWLARAFTWHGPERLRRKGDAS